MSATVLQEMINTLRATPADAREAVQTKLLGNRAGELRKAGIADSVIRSKIDGMAEEIQTTLDSDPTYAPPGASARDVAAMELESASTGGKRVVSADGANEDDQVRERTAYQRAQEALFSGSGGGDYSETSSGIHVGLDRDGRRVLVDGNGRVTSMAKAKIELERASRGLSPLEDDE
jgi:hypothetical protein